jgi:putative ABC transport system permease protein
MSPVRSFSLAARSLRRNRLRTFLMMLGVIVGVASLTILTSIGQATRQETIKRFKRMVGTYDTVIVRPGGGAMMGMPTLANTPATLTIADTEAIATLPGVRRVAQVQTAFGVNVAYRGRTDTPGVFGVSANWMALRDDQVAEGAFLSDDDVQALARVAVIGTDVRRALFPAEDPIGRTIRIGDVPFRVTGVLASQGAGPAGGDLDDVIMIPVTTASRRLFNRAFLSMAIAQLADPGQSAAVMQEITTLLRGRHHISPPARDDFTLTDPQAVLQRIIRIGTTLSRILIGVSIVAMLIGGIVIMSLMLIGVAERRREIGVRRSVGASRSDILVQFLAEALVVSCGGGLVGILIGLGGTGITTRLEHLPPILFWNALAIAVVLSIGIGLAFGLYPAWKAARVDPIGALRS